ncbi:hypothetical protein B0A48_14951 [Cryoendolithus antarcticus]|uniref:Uncharacterized protein n=1 Tax=Cryoendolithus antarcticus TaxID=1507870 RepID=A0A1V8SJF2_9PEZI|nr:hypothetical protein B0A48_14951 [Cryoendolithus antarcticus]
METKAPSAAERSLAVAKSPLFTKIPGELRNRVWELVVIAESSIPFSSTGATEPDLLLVCHLIRKEAGGIYYGKNSFHVTCEHYDSTTVLLARRKHDLFDAYDEPGKAEPLYVVVSDQPDRTNLMVWVRRVHARLTPAPTIEGPPIRPDQPAVQALLQMAASMRGTPWPEVEATPKWQRLVLAHIDEAWGDGTARDKWALMGQGGD